MDKTELLQLREQILGDIVPLVLETSEGSADAFALLLRIIQAGNASGEIYAKAYESAKSLEDTDTRLNALLSLLDEIDFDTTTNSPAQPPEAENVLDQNNQQNSFEQN